MPMIVAMPGIEVSASVSLGSPETRDMLDREMVADIVPLAEHYYRTINRPADAVQKKAAEGFEKAGIHPIFRTFPAGTNIRCGATRWPIWWAIV